LFDLKTGMNKILECNSDQSESFHSWSSNSRWLVFSSKRLDGFCARPYFCIIDHDGTASKPILLPQKDPLFYDTFLKTYNVPELVQGPIRINPRTWAQTAMGKTLYQANLDPHVTTGGLRPDSDKHQAESRDLYQKASQ
jgi:hypothetical protein